MKRLTKAILLLAGGLLLATGGPTLAATGNIDSTDQYGWSETSGWVNFHPGNGGVSVYSDHLRGHAWAENIGWIKLGVDAGGPYTNNTSANWGVNHDGSGNLSGYAWSETVGWINFNPSHRQVSIDFSNGKFAGYAWAENIGWVRLQNPTSYNEVWSENTGWINPQATHGAVTVNTDHLIGYAWAENIGWVKLGVDVGGPYTNSTAANWGVNRDGSNNLSGYGWSENAGWINFNSSHGQVTVGSRDRLEGFAWAENFGWIHFYGFPDYVVALSTSVDSDSDGMPDVVYELLKGFDPFNGADGAADADSDNVSNAVEYRHNTDPKDSNDFPQPYADVPPAHADYLPILALDDAGIATGCSAGNFCPKQIVAWETVALWLLKAAQGSGFTPSAFEQKYSDVTSGAFGDT